MKLVTPLRLEAVDLYSRFFLFLNLESFLSFHVEGQENIRFSCLDALRR